MTCRPAAAGGFTATSGGYSEFWIYDKQAEALSGGKSVQPLMNGLTGRDLHGRQQIEAFLHEKYRLLDPDWFTPLQDAWSRITLGFQGKSHGADKRYVPGWPAFFLVAGAGMLVSLVPRDRLWRFHLPWLGAFLGVWFAVMLTGVVNPRYRFVFEPYCVFYAFLLLDFLWSAVAALVNLPRGSRAARLQPGSAPPAQP
jgi:hypothetical protein